MKKQLIRDRLGTMASRAASEPVSWRFQVADPISRFGNWWLKECLGLLPAKIANWLLDWGTKRLSLVPDGPSAIFELFNDRGHHLASTTVADVRNIAASIDEFLKMHAAHRHETTIGMRIPRDCIFCREFVLPREVGNSLPHVVVQDLIGKTPFRLADIYHDYVARQVGEKLYVWQWVVRRSFVEDAVKPLGMNPDDPAFLEAADDEGIKGPRPFLRLKKAGNQRRQRIWQASLILAIAAMVLAIIWGGITYWRQQTTLHRLEAEIAAARTNAQNVRSAIDQLERSQAAIAHLRARKSEEPTLLQTWNEISRILPANSWLNEFRFTNSHSRQQPQVVMTGYSSEAAKLVSILDRSPLFLNTSLTAPISFDHTVQRERFVLQINVISREHTEPLSQ